MICCLILMSQMTPGRRTSVSVFGCKQNRNIKGGVSLWGQSCLGFGNMWIQKVKNKTSARADDVHKEWISAVSCQISNKAMFSCENLNEFVCSLE